MKYLYTTFLIIFFTTTVVFAADDTSSVIQSHPSFCVEGLHNQPNGPFAIMLFCEDALATHLGVIYKEQMSNPLDGAWFISDRFWQEPDWAADVTAYAWESSGKHLIVATSPIYGSGNIYRLDLKNRQYEIIFNLKSFAADINKHICMIQMKSFNEKKKSVLVEAIFCNRQGSEHITVQY